jgi:hypothetical protein
MTDWQPRKAVEAQSEKTALFCPDCKQELDTLTLINGADTCYCGTWSYAYDSELQFKPEDKS